MGSKNGVKNIESIESIESIGSKQTLSGTGSIDSGSNDPTSALGLKDSVPALEVPASALQDGSAVPSVRVLTENEKEWYAQWESFNEAVTKYRILGDGTFRTRAWGNWLYDREQGSERKIDDMWRTGVRYTKKLLPRIDRPYTVEAISESAFPYPLPHCRPRKESAVKTSLVPTAEQRSRGSQDEQAFWATLSDAQFDDGPLYQAAWEKYQADKAEKAERVRSRKERDLKEMNSKRAAAARRRLEEEREAFKQDKKAIRDWAVEEKALATKEAEQIKKEKAALAAKREEDMKDPVMAARIVHLEKIEAEVRKEREGPQYIV